MLKIGGENVASLEIERVINAIDGIEESAVIACHHPMLDEIPVAFVRVRGSLADADEAAVASRVIASCRNLLADFKVPREVYVLEDFPRASVGKIAKPQLRELRRQKDRRPDQ
jgi:crotonobetaine/carnitine-CoA ligase